MAGMESAEHVMQRELELDATVEFARQVAVFANALHAELVDLDWDSVTAAEMAERAIPAFIRGAMAE
jgi:hypothetical protein